LAAYAQIDFAKTGYGSLGQAIVGALIYARDGKMGSPKAG